MSLPSFDSDLVRAIADAHDDVRQDREPSRSSLRRVERAVAAGDGIVLDLMAAAGGNLGSVAAELRNLGPDALRLAVLSLVLRAGVARCPSCGSEDLTLTQRDPETEDVTCDECGTSWPVEKVADE